MRREAILFASSLLLITTSPLGSAAYGSQGNVKAASSGSRDRRTGGRAAIPPGLYIEAYYGEKGGGPPNHAALAEALRPSAAAAGVGISCASEFRTKKSYRDILLAVGEPRQSRECGNRSVLVGPFAGLMKAGDFKSRLEQNIDFEFGMALYSDLVVVGAREIAFEAEPGLRGLNLSDYSKRYVETPPPSLQEAAAAILGGDLFYLSLRQTMDAPSPVEVTAVKAGAARGILLATWRNARGEHETELVFQKGVWVALVRAE